MRFRIAKRTRSGSDFKPSLRMAEVLWLSTVFTLKSKTVAICLLLLPLGRERGLPSERTSGRLASRLMAMPILPSWRLSELIREAATELGSRVRRLGSLGGTLARGRP
jgi:hypothetical protein